MIGLSSSNLTFSRLAVLKCHAEKARQVKARGSWMDPSVLSGIQMRSLQSWKGGHFTKLLISFFGKTSIKNILQFSNFDGGWKKRWVKLPLFEVLGNYVPEDTNPQNGLHVWEGDLPACDAPPCAMLCCELSGSSQSLITTCLFNWVIPDLFEIFGVWYDACCSSSRPRSRRLFSIPLTRVVTVSL